MPKFDEGRPEFLERKPRAPRQGHRVRVGAIVSDIRTPFDSQSLEDDAESETGGDMKDLPKAVSVPTGEQKHLDHPGLIAEPS
ncbi:hypothetical protein GCM10019071_33690 [Sphingobium fuliginis]|uniref:Uncharacterized protein n=1 Tax=Sphingobium fuliginis (strain ATCC 27551) TaxID=336203 RepID=A0ABQ1F6X6_SPHSA|nr:hypothetical protein GCM10019071_33690 [Sphingobium fuliginis]